MTDTIDSCKDLVLTIPEKWQGAGGDQIRDIVYPKCFEGGPGLLLLVREGGS